jgi:transposase-like protein
LSFRACSRAIEPFVKRSHKSIWEWVQEIGSNKSFHRLFRLGRERVNVFAMDETRIKVGRVEAFLIIAYEAFEERILGLYFTWNPNSNIRGAFLKGSNQKIWQASGVDGWRRMVFSRMRIPEYQTFLSQIKNTIGLR